MVTNRKANLKATNCVKVNWKERQVNYFNLQCNRSNGMSCNKLISAANLKKTPVSLCAVQYTSNFIG